MHTSPKSQPHLVSASPSQSPLERLQAQIHRHLDEISFFSAQSWVPPLMGPSNKLVYDAVVIGGGQAGLSTAFGLMLGGVKRVVVLERQPEGLAGPWKTHARMKTLRTPKDIRGPELGVMPLAFQSWYEAKHGLSAYAKLDKIPTDVWWQYLAWFRGVLDLPVRHGRSVVALDHDPAVGALRVSVERDGVAEAPLFARKVVLCTGLEGCGSWNVPGVIAQNLPRARYQHTSESIDFARFQGKRVGIVGAGLSSFDAAREALRAGASQVHHFCRRRLAEREPFGHLWRGRDDGFLAPRVRPPFAAGAHDEWKNLERPADLLSTFIAHVRGLDDARRWHFLSQIFHNGHSTATRSAIFGGEPWPAAYHFHEQHPIDALRLEGDAIKLDAAKRTFSLDSLILGTGVTPDLSRRPELRGVAKHVATWRDRFVAPEHEENEDLARFPYLGSSFELCERDPGETPWISSIFALIDPLHLSVGIHSMHHDVRRLVDGLAAQLFADSAEHHFDFLEESVRKACADAAA